MDTKKKYFVSEKQPIILDLGICFTKVGLVGENAPRKIIETPKELFANIKDLNTQKFDQLYKDVENCEKMEQELENFLHDLFFVYLLVSPKERSIIYCENYLMPRNFVESLAKVLFKRFEVPKIHFLLSNTLPLYLSGVFSGLIVDSGFLETQVTVISDGYPIMTAFKRNSAGGLRVSQEVYRIIKEENVDVDLKAIDFNLIENMKFKFVIVPLRNQLEDYMGNNENIQMMKEKSWEHQVNQKTVVKMSYYGRIMAGNSLFGNDQMEEPNIAYTLLESLLSLDSVCRRKVCQNIILSGGNVHLKNFARRMRQELLYLIENREEFKAFSKLKEHITFTNIMYPPNCLNFIGASMIGNLSSLEKFACSKPNFFAAKEVIPDRTGDAYLFVNRKSIFYNSQVEDITEMNQFSTTKQDNMDGFPVSIKEVELADTYGFLPSAEDIEEENTSEKLKTNTIIKNQKKINARIEKWRLMLPNIDDMILRKDSLRIPDGLRTKIWPKLAEIQKFQLSDNYSYKNYLERKSQFEDVIMMDIDRTYPNHIFFKNNQSIGQKSLFNVLKALSTCFPEMGYCQGLNFIIGMFLIYLNDEESFWMGYSLMIKYKFLDRFVNPKNVEKPLFVFDKLLSKYIPKVAAKLQELQLISALYASNWFLTLYIYSLCFKTCLRIVDMFLLEGESALVKVALAIIKSKEKELLKCQGLIQAIPLLKNIKKTDFDEENLIKSTSKFKISPSDFDKLMKEFMELNKIQAHDIELKQRKNNKKEDNEIPDENQAKVASSSVVAKRMVDYMHYQN